MANIVDERGYNQIFKPSKAASVRLRRRAQAIFAEISQSSTAETLPRKKILELGCGTGELAYNLAMLTRAQVTGVDLSAQFISRARALHQHDNLAFIVADLTQMMPHAESEKYDYIVGNGILHHLYHDLDSFLPALARWLAPSGRLIFWEPNLMNPYVYSIFSIPALRLLAHLEPGEMAFTPRFVRQKLRQAGFASAKVTTRDFLLPNTPAFLIRPVIAVGGVLEKIPLARSLAQSLFITAQVES